MGPEAQPLHARRPRVFCNNVIEKKLERLDARVSQMHEWLPW